MEKNNETVTHAVAEAEEPSWPELLGSNNWEGLLDPLNLTLRRFILLSGDFCQCTYDAFNDDKNSKYYASSRYGKRSFFHKVKFEAAADYQISCLLYSTATLDDLSGSVTWDRETNFIGYIATTTDAASLALGRREIRVVWRGTKTNYEWIDVAHFAPVSATDLVSEGGETPAPIIMDGWLKLYLSNDPSSAFMKLSARDQLHRRIQELLEEYRNETLSIVVNGHSLGGALAVLSAFDLAENVVPNSIPVAAVVFGCPQVGDANFTARLEQLHHLKILHIKNRLDPIPLYPGIIMNAYKDAGIEFPIDCRKSPYLRIMPKDLFDWHNLQGILHVVAGWNGADQNFELKVKRSIALVNKSCQFLKDEFAIPPAWWSVENKGMVLDRHGNWILAPPPDEDIPVPEFF